VVCSLWFFVTVWAAKMNKYEPEDRVEKFFENQNRPVDHDGEGGKDSDNSQGVAMGVLCLIYGGFISLLAIVIPNGLTGRLSFLFCGLVIGGIGFGIYRFGKKKSPSTE
jgi:SSS family solute:Na+ symporter